jgi:hypothetical protein
MRSFYIVLSCFLLASAQVKGQSTPAFSQEPEARHIKFYPNPAISVINFDLQKAGTNETYSFQVFNFLGKKVYESTNVNAHTSINLTDFARGIYIFQLKDQSGRVIETGRFQVNK